MRRAGIGETALFFALAFAVDYGWGGGDRFSAVCPHPYWAIVVLMAAQYGTGEALFAAAASTVALLAGNMPARSISIDMHEYLWLVARQPVLWFVAASVLGELRRRHMGIERDLRRLLSDAVARETSIASAFEKQNVLKQQLETAVASNLSSALTLYHAAKEVERLDPQEVLRGVSGLVKAVMNPHQFSLFLLDGSHVECAFEEGWKASDTYRRSFASGSALFDRVIGERQLLCVSRFEDEVTLGAEGVLAGPLVNPQSGEVIGLLKIEKLGFLSLNFSSIQSFQTLCDWIATAWSKARQHERAASESMTSQESPLLSHVFFDRQTAFLTRVAQRLKFDLSLMTVRLENAAALDREAIDRIPQAFHQAVKTVLRTTDLAFESGRREPEFIVLLTGTPVANGRIVADKLLQALERELDGSASAARFGISMQSLYRKDDIRIPAPREAVEPEPLEEVPA